MLYNVSEQLKKLGLSEKTDKIIVAVSGGPDSVALLHILLRLNYDCIAAHCNFHLRMEESDADETFVRNFCKELKVELHCIEFETVKYAFENKMSVEMAARELRYAWFEKKAAETRATAIATGHHADDNVETLLLNLMRGTGIKGLTGIPPRNGKIIRPLLGCTRSEIIRYLNDNQLHYRTDATNLQNDYIRNKIRNVILPQLEEINPSIKHTLTKTINILGGIRRFYEQAIEEKKKSVVENSGNQTIINIEKLLSTASPELLLFEILYPIGFHPAVIEQIVNCLNGEPGKLFYAENYRLLKDRNHLIISANSISKDKLYFISQNETLISTPFVMKIDRFQRTKDFEIKKNPEFLFVDAEMLQFPLEIRRWQKSDVFFPFGMKGRKKLSDYFIDEKMSILDKENVWLLLSGGDIMWIAGLRADNRFRITGETKEIIKFELL